MNWECSKYIYDYCRHPERNLFSSKMKFMSIMYIETSENPVLRWNYHSFAKTLSIIWRCPDHYRAKSAPDSQIIRSHLHQLALEVHFKNHFGFEVSITYKKVVLHSVQVTFTTWRLQEWLCLWCLNYLRVTPVTAILVILCSRIKIKDNYISFERLCHFLHDLAISGLD